MTIHHSSIILCGSPRTGADSNELIGAPRRQRCWPAFLILLLILTGCGSPGPEAAVHLFVHHYVNNRPMALEHFDLRPEGVERLSPQERAFHAKPMLMAMFRESIREEEAGLMRVNTANVRTRLVSKGEDTAVVHLAGRIEYVYRGAPTRVVELDNLVNVRKEEGRWKVHGAVFGVGG